MFVHAPRSQKIGNSMGRAPLSSQRAIDEGLLEVIEEHEEVQRALNDGVDDAYDADYEAYLKQVFEVRLTEARQQVAKGLLPNDWFYSQPEAEEDEDAVKIHAILDDERMSIYDDGWWMIYALED